jgi:hypothetical protein
MNKTNFVLHIPRTWEGAKFAWCGRDLSKINAWSSRVEFLNAEDDKSCKHCLVKRGRRYTDQVFSRMSDL